MSASQFEKTPARLLPKLQTRSEDIKAIVQALNSPPFSLGLSLVSFDEKTPLELLELFNEVLSQLDSKHKLDVRDEAQEETANRITEFLKVLNYPISNEHELQKGIVFGDKKVIYPILHYILTNLSHMQQRAYLARYLVNIYVPEDLLMEDDMKEVYQQYKELQAQFQVCHQEIEQQRSQAMPPHDLQRENDQLEAEKEQLVTKIGRFKSKYANKEDFQEILEATSILRKEQEEEARLYEKLQEQKGQLEWVEGNLMAAQQRLLDVKKISSGDTTALDMLNLLKQDVKRNREFCHERIGRELTEKMKRLEQVEQLLSQPLVTQSDVDALQNEVRILQREVQMLEEKANKSQNAGDDKLTVFKQQASMVSKMKEQLLDKLKSLEQEESKYEKKMAQKEQEYEKVRGGNKFMSRDDFHKYAQSLRTKKNQYQQMKTQLRDIRSELAVLDRTEKILKSKLEDSQKVIRDIERRFGIEGYSETKDAMEEVSALKQNIDLKKGATLQEISNVVDELNNKLKAARARLSPLVAELRNARARYSEINTEYEAKKSAYEGIAASMDGERDKIEAEVKQLEEEASAQESKYHLLQSKLLLTEVQLQRVLHERACRNGERRFNQEFKSLQEYYNYTLNRQNSETTELRSKQKNIKESHDINSTQVKMFENLRKLLSYKIKVLQEEISSPNEMRGRDLGGESGMKGVNRLVIED